MFDVQKGVGIIWALQSLSIDDIRFMPNEDFLGPIYGSSV